ncbi:MAG: DUF3526 domain-containing protein [Methylococcales bacterium]|nr:DUF3526 domain-containing protein [Methylococcales bacterium]MDP3839639.1 DUF3526 domain-containing protein [Methylococcales bacterium]
MMNLITIEWTRFSRNALNLWIVGLFMLMMMLSAVWSGLAAREFRAHVGEHPTEQSVKPTETHDAAKHADTANSAEMHDAPKQPENKEKASAFSASSKAPPLDLPALGGLTLNASQMDFLSTHIKVSTRSRHTDGRTTDSLFNPLMHEFGFLDFATLLALLTPLVIVALTYGLVQEDRESGVWRLVCTQTAKPWQLVFTALAVRYGLLLAVILSSSLISFVMDSDATANAVGHWLLFSSLYTLVWFAIAGLFLLLPVSSGAAAIAMLGTWLILTFAVPAGLGWAANQYAKMPSRMTTIIDIRHFQEQTNSQRPAILAQWYAAHPDIQQPAGELPRDIANLPAALQLDKQIRPLMTQFEHARQQQFEFMERWSFLSPSLAVILMADRLAGIDAPRYAQFIEQVNQFEDQWRDFFVPKIMSNAEWTAQAQQNIPVFHFTAKPKTSAYWRLSLIQLATVTVLLSGLFLLRRQFTKT